MAAAAGAPLALDEPTLARVTRWQRKPERLVVTPEQIKLWNLPTRPTKTTDKRSNGFGDISVELDAINPTQLRDLVEEAINRHLPQQQLRVLQEAERSERQLLEVFARRAAA